MKLNDIKRSTRSTLVLPVFPDEGQRGITPNAALTASVLRLLNTGAWLKTSDGQQALANASKIAEKWDKALATGEDASIVKRYLKDDGHHDPRAWLEPAAVLTAAFDKVAVKQLNCDPARGCYGNALQYVRQNPKASLVIGFITAKKEARQPTSLTAHAWVKDGSAFVDTTKTHGLVASYHAVLVIPANRLPETEADVETRALTMGASLDEAARIYLKEDIGEVS